MLNQKIKIVYSLKIHIALQQQGFVPLTEMKNPNNQYLNCWVYAATPDLLSALDSLIEEAGRHGK